MTVELLTLLTPICFVGDGRGLVVEPRYSSGSGGGGAEGGPKLELVVVKTYNRMKDHKFCKASWKNVKRRNCHREKMNWRENYILSYHFFCLFFIIFLVVGQFLSYQIQTFLSRHFDGGACVPSTNGRRWRTFRRIFVALIMTGAYASSLGRTGKSFSHTKCKKHIFIQFCYKKQQQKSTKVFFLLLSGKNLPRFFFL